MALLPDGRVVVVERAASSFAVIEGDGLRELATVGGLPNSVAVGLDGLVYIGRDGEAAGVPAGVVTLRLDTGRVSLASDNLGGMGFAAARSVRLGPDGAVYFVAELDGQSGGARICRLHQGLSTVEVDLGTARASSLAFDPDGTLAWVQLQPPAAVFRRAGGLVVVELPDGTVLGGCTFGDDGRLLVAAGPRGVLDVLEPGCHPVAGRLRWSGAQWARDVMLAGSTLWVADAGTANAQRDGKLWRLEVPLRCAPVRTRRTLRTAKVTAGPPRPRHEAESGLPSHAETCLVGEWLEMVIATARGEHGPGGWLGGWLCTELPFAFTFGGNHSSLLLPHWPLTVNGPASQPEGIEVWDLTWRDPSGNLTLTWSVRRFRDFPALEWLVTAENCGSGDALALEGLQVLSLRLRHDRPGAPWTIRAAAGGRSLPDDMAPLTYRLPGGAVDRMTLGGDPEWSSNRHLPFFGVQSPEDRGVIVGIGWSGSWSADIALEHDGLHAAAGTNHMRVALRPGERLRSPRILVLAWEGRPLHGHNQFRGLLQRHYVPALPDPPGHPLVSHNFSFSYDSARFGWMLERATEEDVLAIVKPYLDLGLELFIIDACWYEASPLHALLRSGQISGERYPEGFGRIAQELAAGGARLGLWFAPEVVRPDELAADHPDWLTDTQLPTPLGVYNLPRLERPEVRAWFIEQVDRLLREGVGCYRQDQSGAWVDESPERAGLDESRHVEALYELWDEIRRRHPELVMEGCCHGGRRIDLETLSRFHWHQKSDRWFDSESDQCSLYGANLFLPGGVINIPVRGTDDYSAWSGFAGQLCLAWHPTAGEFDQDQARRQVGLYKAVRHLLCGDFYPLTGCAPGDPWIGYQFHRRDLDEGFALVFHRFHGSDACLAGATTGAFRACLRGIDPSHTYVVCSHSDGARQVRSGEELGAGIAISLPEVPSAELLAYRGQKRDSPVCP